MSFLRSVFRNIVYLIIVIIVLFALVSVLARELTPLVDQHRGDFERYASEALHIPITIKQVRASWRQYQPVIDLEEVVFHSRETQKPILAVKRLTLFFSIPQSLWSRELVTRRISIDGAHVSIKQSENSEYVIQELRSLGLEQLPGQETKFKDVMNWLSHISKLTLHNIELAVTRANDIERHITLRDLQFENSGLSHHIEGDAILHQKLSTEVKVVADWQGEEFDTTKINSKIYLYVSGLNLPQWLQKQSWQNWFVREGVASARIWIDWSQGQLRQVQSQVQLYELILKSLQNDEERTISRMSGHIGLKYDNQQLIIAGDDILLNLPRHLWPVTNFYLSSKASGSTYNLKQFKMSYLDLHDMQSFSVPILKGIPEKLSQLINQLQVQGTIQNLAIDFANDIQDWQHLRLKAQMQHVSTKPWEQYPGFKNLTGSFEWLGASGALRLNSEKTTFIAPKIFNNDLYFDQLTGLLELKQDDQKHWQLNLANLQLLNRDLAFTAQGRFTLLSEKLPIADITAHFTVQEVAQINRYLPLALFEKDLSQWLKQAFLKGELQSGEAVLRGPLDQYPFDKGGGKLTVKGRINHVDLKFAPDWPTLEKINGNIIFLGRKLEIGLDDAEILGLKTIKARGVIRSIGGEDPAILEVITQPINMNLSDSMHYIFNSPLKKTLGKMLKDLTFKGSSQLSLSLKIPLEHPDQTAVKGGLSFKDAILIGAPYDLTLSNLNGALTFTEDSLQAKKIQAVLFNKPFQFDLTTVQKNNRSVIQLMFDQHFNLTDIEQWLKYSFSSYLSGSTQIVGTIDLMQDEPVKIALKSNLKGLAIHADSPIVDKTEQKEKDFSAELFVAANVPLKIRLQYDNQINAALILSREKNDFKLTSANLHFGSGTPFWPTKSGLFITGQLDVLDQAKIKTYLQQNNTSEKALPLKGMDVGVRSFHMGGLTLTNLTVKATPENQNQNQNWSVAISSQEMIGHLTIPKKWSQQGMINAHFDKVYLTTGSDNTESTALQLDLKSIPGMAVEIDDFNINKMSLGRLNFDATPSGNGFVINTMNLTAPHLSLRSSGLWQQAGKQTKTMLEGEATSPNVTHLLERLALPAKNFKAGTGNMKYNLNWLGAPFEASIRRIQGEVSLSIGEGRIVDVGKEGGAKMDLARMLSLFSLQTIPRRLSFNFSDVFQKGYTFDSLTGNFILKNGDLFTRNMKFEGPVASLAIQGRIGLTKKDYDLVLDVTAHVTSTIPVAATLLTGNPLIGVGAFLANALVGSKVAGYEYTIKGPWDNPTWQSAKPKH